MIAKTSIGRSFKGCCGYVMQKVELGKGHILMSQGVRDYDTRSMVADFTRQASMNPDLSRSVWHTAISFNPQDEARLAAKPELMKEVASEYLKGMGLDQSQYIVVRHQDTAHAHFHIVANRVADNGHTISDSHNFSRSETLLRQIEQKYELTPMMELGKRMSLERVPELDRYRIEMREQVQASLSRSTNGQELRDDLAKHGISLAINRNQAGQARGIHFEMKVQDEGEKERSISFKGSKLHQSLSIGRIQEQLAINLERKLALEASRKLEQKQDLNRGLGHSM